MSVYDQVDSALVGAMSSKLAMHNPGGTLFSEWYPSPYNAEHHVAKALNKAGTIRISSNNLNLGATSNFTISASELVYGFALNCSITTPANSVIAFEGWFFSLIDRVSITIANSNMSALTLSGLSMRELILAACDSKEKRDMVIKAAGSPTAAATVTRASIPIAWMINLGIGVGMGGQYPIDMATISGSIQVDITFNSSTTIVSRTGAAPEAVTTFNQLYLSALSTQILEPQFAVRKAMESNPSLIYSIPGKYLSYTRYTQIMTPGTASTLQIGSVPLGELQAIILTVKPVIELTATADGALIYPGSCRLSQLQLDYAGTTIYRADNWQEHLQNMREKFQGDDKTYSYVFCAGNTVSAAASDLIDTQVLIVPLCYDGKDVMTCQNTEYLPGYSGSTLSLTLTVMSTTAPDLGARGLRDAATPFFSAPINPEPFAGPTHTQNYIIECLFLMNSVLTVDTSTVNYHV